MGLTHRSSGISLLREKFNVKVEDENELIIALAGNPNVGKSTVFNYLTGLNQHTGNWPGKTICNARGSYTYKNRKFTLVDLPGTYSLLASSVEEEVARDFICFAKPDATIVVSDATCLERNLNLALQVMELTDKVILCVNLMDEAKRKGIEVDIECLEKELGIPVVATTARTGEGIDKLIDKVYEISLGIKKYNPRKIIYSQDIENEVKNLTLLLDNILDKKLDSRWVALRILEGDKTIINSINNYLYKT
ncbi:small GTP-binding protein domain-containing protein [Alkalithermobacter thermoalcaliphilus JW-YL-7 = DSM 7308]|uniref:Ferrous iron transport protein B domain-containing protein n=1 Tax=Alkalithermobacter thermoalcaliphilus JW-YL-7 = DSM 7308 TaxID=1121328 RepID=A0A150FMK7_CLOPD|nr:Ferrous iron transport protein B domain-containing protein [[Clostridium] paradoxum JW-YL-7 = DSM 7308]SHL21311.1 small GTP-binding protein domain-containing protein [[Clostridium] paradoxum JW-YL-7 = DSM 7308]